MTNIAQIGQRRVTVGVDTHLDNHVAAVKDELGRDLGHETFPANSRGYKALLAYAGGFGTVEHFGLEGTGSYGAGLARFLKAEGESVFEVSRPKRQDRRRYGKSDPADARAAARAVQAGDATSLPKSADSGVEMLRVLRGAKDSAMKARTQALNVLRATIVTAPAGLREDLEGLPQSVLIRRAVALRPGPMVNPLAAAKFALRSLARRYQELDSELQGLVEAITKLTAEISPGLVSTFGIGPDTAANLLVAAGDNPERMRSEAAFSMLCGASPVDASSGKQIRHRLNRGGDRKANASLHRVVLTRMRWHEPTREYVERRTAEGKTKKEIMRCLKRYVAREVYNILMAPANETAEAAA
jgi:transposase